jgi:hypothetical protein
LYQSKYPPLIAAYTTLSLFSAHLLVGSLSLAVFDETTFNYKLGSRRSILAYPPVNLVPN